MFGPTFSAACRGQIVFVREGKRAYGGVHPEHVPECTQYSESTETPNLCSIIHSSLALVSMLAKAKTQARITACCKLLFQMHLT